MRGKITMQIVGFNSANDLEKAVVGLKVLRDDVFIRYIDNNSTDGSVEVIRRNLPDADVIELDSNVGFSEANNIGFRKCDTEFVMLHNPDLIVDFEGVKKVLTVFADKAVGAAQGKLYRDVSGEKKIIDSVGILMTLALNGKERGAGEEDNGQYDQITEVSAVTGASAIYRMSSLREVAYPDMEVFDKDFFAYKEEVDLGWRLRKAGWKCMYVPVVQGIHARAVRSHGVGEYLAKPRLLINKLGDQRTKYSFRNWLWMIIKNTTVKDAFKHEIFVDLRLICFMLISLFYWPLMSVWLETIKGIPAMLKKKLIFKP